ncbi:MAG TPA: cutinase family protein [Mycobacterium sp.]|uniref:cutinase family protein n=1 Tax=Mycobacterium sp. TaxID=1785 RepID=UPI002CED938B|nr:cutinase family protein [Mycobacterium sp.]HME79547.1 cutinase family protein [Mycobacterium sp.]
MKFAPSAAKRLVGFAAAGLLAAGLLIAPALAPFPAGGPIPKASAGCPDAEVDFARGREEAPGVGEVGQAFINSLQKKVPHMTIGSYGVNYPADVSITDGSNDMSAHVQQMVASCPNTKLVLGGYSLGAAAADVVVAMNRPGFGYTDPMPPNMDQHIAGVALFGNGTQRVLGPVPNFSPAFAGKTIDLCAGGDPICTRGIHDLHWSSHLQNSYITSGLVDQAASFVAGRL